MPYPLPKNAHLLVLTGAGISAESGLATFRASDGLWEGHRVEDVASPEGFERDPEVVWRFYVERRRAALTAEPNRAHETLVSWEHHVSHFLLVTQNVDDLHRRAGSTQMLEIHGNLFRTRCHACDRAPYDDHDLSPPLHESCTQCQKSAQEISFTQLTTLRPDIVWFGEMLDPSHLQRIDNFMNNAARSNAPFYFVAVGTSGNVYPAAGLVEVARRAGAETHLVNFDAPVNRHAFTHFHQGPATEVLPSLFELGT